MDHPWQDLLLYLYNDGRKWFSNLEAKDWRRELVGQTGVVDSLNVQVMADPWHVQKHLRGKSDPKDVERKGIVLRPCKHAEDSLTVLVPFILDNQARARLSLQLGVLEDRPGARTFFGYRFESPETFQEHRFHHVQPLTALGHGPPLAQSAAWYPDRYPSFPLAASTSEELVTAVLVALREWNPLLELTTSGRIPRPARLAISEFLERINPRRA